MTADQIRDEAIERAAKAMAALECPGPPDHRHYATAEAMIDALGDMLPTGIEEEGGFIIRNTGLDIVHVEPTQRRYVTEWQQVVK